MTIAVITDYAYKNINFYREGIGVYANHLCKGLLDADPTLHIEFWQYSFNTPHMKRAYKLAAEAYPDRVSFHDEGGLGVWKASALFFVRAFFKALKIVFRFFNSALNESLKQKIIQSSLKGALKKDSKADAYYTSYLLLPLTAEMDGIKVMQVHDLFWFTLRDVFARENRSVDMYNDLTLKYLLGYVKKKAFFVCSTEYTKKEILKYIPNITPERIIAISIPPMIGDFAEVSPQYVAEVKAKFNITKPYTFMASQNRPNKNWPVLLKALARLRDEGISLDMVATGKICGTKQAAHICKELQLQSSLIETGGLSSEELAALYKGAAMVVVPTYIEGYGMSGQGLEALKAGVPVIHSLSLGMEESLASVGLSFETADLNWFECDDDLALAVNIKKVLADPQLHIQKQKHILAAYTDITWQDTAREYLKIFYKGLSASKGGDSGKP